MDSCILCGLYPCVGHVSAVFVTLRHHLHCTEVSSTSQLHARSVAISVNVEHTDSRHSVKGTHQNVHIIYIYSYIVLKSTNLRIGGHLTYEIIALEEQTMAGNAFLSTYMFIYVSWAGLYVLRYSTIVTCILIHPNSYPIKVGASLTTTVTARLNSVASSRRSYRPVRRRR